MILLLKLHKSIIALYSVLFIKSAVTLSSHTVGRADVELEYYMDISVLFIVIK